MTAPDGSAEEWAAGRPGHPERLDAATVPRIYLASLSDYNAGRLHGTWIEAGDVEPMAQAIAEMLGQSSEEIAEDYAIHDLEGFGPLHLGEHDSLGTVARIGHGIAGHGLAFVHWVSYIGTADDEGFDMFEDHYLGHWRSVQDYAQSVVDDLGIEQTLDTLDLPLGNYVRVDIEALARDLEIELHASPDPDGVHLFTPR